MDRHLDRVSSPKIAEMLGTNPVVVRRIMSGLRDKGYVSSQKGRGGGWTLSVALDTISLRDIYEAIDTPSLLSFGAGDPEASCLVEQAIHQRLSKTLRNAEMQLLSEFEDVSVADIADDFDKRLAAHEERQQGQT